MRIGVFQLPALLEDLRVDAVAAKQALFDADLGQPLDRDRELGVNQLVVPHLGRDSAQPDMGLSDVGRFLHALRHVQRLLGKLAGGLDVVLQEAELTQAHQHVAAPNLEVGFLGQLERAIEMLVSGAALSLRHQDEAQIVLGSRKRDAIPKDFEQSDGPAGVLDCSVHVSRLAVGQAESAVHLGHPGQVEHRPCSLDCFLVQRDRLRPTPVADMHRGEDRQQSRFRGRGHGIYCAADGQSSLGKVLGVGLLGYGRDSCLVTHALSQHQCVVD